MGGGLTASTNCMLCSLGKLCKGTSLHFFLANGPKNILAHMEPVVVVMEPVVVVVE